MRIPYFASEQDLVFVPALAALLAAAVLVCLPIVFAPALRRGRRLVPVGTVLGVLGVLALAVAVWQVAVGVGTLSDQRATVQRAIQQRYGADLSSAEVGQLIDGGKPRKAFPEQAEAAGLAKPTALHPLELVPTTTGADTYRLTIGGKPWPKPVRS